MLRTMYVEHPEMGEVISFFDLRFEVDGIEYVHPTVRPDGPDHGEGANYRPMFELVDDNCTEAFCTICGTY